MPISATVPLQNLVDPSVQDSLQKPLLNGEEQDSNQTISRGRQRHLYISPSLYATPVQAPVPEDSFPDLICASPYVLNHKSRRGGNKTRVDDDDDGDDVNGDDGGGGGEGIIDPRSESMCVGESDFLVGRLVKSHSFASGQGEFFDADDGFSSDGSISNIPSYSSKIESELHAIKLTLLEEIERRKSEEEALVSIRSQYEKMFNIMSQAAGLTFSSFPSAADNYLQLENSSIDQFLQEVVVAKFVAEAIGRAQARAEAEEAAATIIESKDQEILRLQSRLQYFETVNHEMSQRKLVEVARRQHERKRTSRRRWIWSFMGLSIASFVGYLYIPNPSIYLQSHKYGD